MLWVGWLAVGVVGVLSVALHLRRATNHRRVVDALAVARAELRRACEASQRAESTKASLLANVSHELRTPLSLVLSYSEMLLEDAEEQGLTDMAADLRRINDAGQRLRKLIDDMLELAEAESGKMAVFVEEFDLAGLLEEVKSEATPALTARGNVLQFDLAADLGRMKTDRQKLEHTLLLLVENAAKFTEKGRIALTAARVRGKPRDEVVIGVADTGIGMTPEQTGRIFSPFTQGDASTTREYGGTGMGLALCRRFCQLMGGEISVTSARGQGTSFLLTLPVEAPARCSPRE